MALSKASVNQIIQAPTQESIKRIPRPESTVTIITKTTLITALAISQLLSIPLLYDYYYYYE